MVDIGEQTDFNPSTTNTLYDDFAASWQMNMDFAEMYLNILQGGSYLDVFGGKATEAASQYTWRKNNSIALDFAADLINLRVDNIFRTAPVRSYEDSPYATFIEEFLQDVDGGGSDINKFMKKALRSYYVNGIDIVVDKRSSDIQPENLAQERELGIRPYLGMFSPLERVDWSVDHGNNYLWVRYDLGMSPSTDELLSDEQYQQYITFNKNEWRLYSQVENSDKTSSTYVTSGNIGINEVPVVPMYFETSSRSDFPLMPISLLTRISPIARYILNLTSQAQLDLYISVAFMAITGIDADDTPGEITPGIVWTLPEGSTVEEMGKNVAPVVEKREWINLLIGEILRLGKLTGGTGDLEARAASGVQVSLERTDLENEMRSTSEQLEATEEEVMRLAVSRMVGRSITKEELQYNVEYNTKFITQSVNAIIEQAKAFFEIGAGQIAEASPDLAKIVVTKILDALAKDDDLNYMEAWEQIQKATFVKPKELVAETDGSTDKDDIEGAVEDTVNNV